MMRAFALQLAMWKKRREIRRVEEQLRWLEENRSFVEYHIPRYEALRQRLCAQLWSLEPSDSFRSPYGGFRGGRNRRMAGGHGLIASCAAAGAHVLHWLSDAAFAGHSSPAGMLPREMRRLPGRTRPPEMARR